jgi:hypothetical protein
MPGEPSSGIELFDAGKARHWRDKKHFERQRPLSPENIRRLLTELKKGRFTPGTQIYLCVFPNGAEVIVNGNHTLEAIAVWDGAIWLTTTRLPVADINEAGLIYATFDLQKRRTIRDSIQGMGKQIKYRAATTLASAVGVIISGFHQTSLAKRGIAHADIISALDDYAVAAESFEVLTEHAPQDCGRFVKRSSVMAIALETLRYQPTLAEEFWLATAQDTGLIKATPEHSLLRYFRNNPRVYNRKIWANAAAMAWNSKFRNENNSVLRPDAFTNFVLLGTPHHKGVILGKVKNG